MQVDRVYIKIDFEVTGFGILRKLNDYGNYIKMVNYIQNFVMFND